MDNKLITVPLNGIANIQTITEARDGYEKLKALVSFFAKDYNQAYEIAVQMLEYACRGGEIIQEMQSNGELVIRKNMKSQAATSKLSDLDITKSQSSRWQKMASVPEEKREEYYGKMLDKEELPTNAGLLKIAKALKKIKKREEQVQAIKKLEQLPDNHNTRYHVIVIDPPWNYNNRSDDVTHRAANPYPSMTLDELKSIDLPYENDCILWLWTTNAFMFDAYILANHWGFEVKTILTWVKDRMGLGDWLRGKTEHCLMCVRGKPIINLTNQTTVLEGPLREHSRKPDEFYKLIDDLCIGLKIEFFARQKREGWDVYGNETEKF